MRHLVRRPLLPHRYLFVIHGLLPLSRAPLPVTAQEAEQVAQSSFLRTAHGSFDASIVRLATHSPTLTAGATSDFEKELSADPILTSKARPKLVRTLCTPAVTKPVEGGRGAHVWMPMQHAMLGSP